MRIGWTEVLVVLTLVLLLFGGKRLPELARSLGKSLNEFKRGVKETGDAVKKISDDDTPS